MNRRNFLGMFPLLPLVGCGRSKTSNVAVEDVKRSAHIELLKTCKVPVDAKFTTGMRPWAELLTRFPDLKTRARVAIRLHPRYSDEPGATESKLGGTFAWPAGEPWPEEKGHSYLPIVQLRQADCPPHLKFPAGSDLLQLLLNPKVEDKALIHWRTLSQLQPPFAEPPVPPNPADAPVACRFFPERIADYPYIEQMPEGEFKDRLNRYLLENKAVFPDGYYSQHLAAAAGYKVGGYVRDNGATLDTSCPKCRKAMEFVMTLAHDDCDNEQAWAPLEEKTTTSKGYSRAPDYPREKDRHIFHCTRCIDPPAKVVMG